MKTKTFIAEDTDLPSIFSESESRGISPVTTAKTKIHTQAKAMSIEVSSDELQKFALILIALQEG